MSTIVGIDLVGCTVPDVPRALAFYRDTLGMVPNLVHEQGAEFILPNGTTLGIWNPDGTSPASYSMQFAVKDIHAAVGELRSRGLQVSEPMESSVCHMAFAKDPDGNAFILHQRKAKDETPAPQYERTPTSINAIDMASFHVNDWNRAFAFYRDVLGMAPTAIYEERGAEFDLADGSTFGIWRPDEGAAIPNGSMMLAVDDAREKVNELRGKGVTISDVIETPNCFMAWTPDPNGVNVIIHQRKA
jgi:predicted enzyme related to lactoylglutathione lyase